MVGCAFRRLGLVTADVGLALGRILLLLGETGAIVEISYRWMRLVLFWFGQVLFSHKKS